MQQGFRLLFSLIILIMMGGCVSLDLPSESHAPFKKQSWKHRRLALQRIHNWDIDGAFSIQRSTQSVIANYSWLQQGRDYSIHINSSLNAYSTAINGKPGKVTLWRDNDQQFTARSPEQLMQQQLGWSLPLSNLIYWIRGIPAPGKYQGKYDRFGHLINLQQHGWHVQFANYWPFGKVDLPRTLRLTHGNLVAKIIVKHWAL